MPCTLFRLQHSVEDSITVPLQATEKEYALLNKAVSGHHILNVVNRDP